LVTKRRNNPKEMGLKQKKKQTSFKKKRIIKNVYREASSNSESADEVVNVKKTQKNKQSNRETTI
jgi:hypothetical protein